jgi:hypothetical protein
VPKNVVRPVSYALTVEDQPSAWQIVRAYPLGKRLDELNRIGADYRSCRVMQHPGDTQLTWDEVGDALARFEGSPVTVRVVERGSPEMLLAVMAGHLGAMSRSKHPALFWPVDTPASVAHPQTFEEGGFYLRGDRFSGELRACGPGNGPHAKLTSLSD